MASQQQTTLQEQFSLAGIDIKALLRQVTTENDKSEEMSHPSSGFLGAAPGFIMLDSSNERIGNENRPSSSQAQQSPETEQREFDIEEFIEELKNLPSLWNTSLISYKDRTVKSNGWNQLAKFFKKDGKYFVES